MDAEKNIAEVIEALQQAAALAQRDRVTTIALSVVRENGDTATMRAGACCHQLSELNLAIDMAKHDNLHDHLGGDDRICDSAPEAEPDPNTKH